ncbi:MAG: VanW family protein, partial [Microgenomates group bacterium]
SILSLVKNNLPTEITFSSEEQNFSFPPDIVSYQPEKTVLEVLKTGRERFFLLNLQNLFVLFFQGKNLPLKFEIDNSRFDQEIASLSASLYSPPINPQIKLLQTPAEKKIIIETGKKGQELDVRSFKETLLKSLSCPQKKIVFSLPLKTVSPIISPEQAENTKQRALKFLGKTITLKLDPQKWTITDEELISFLSFNNGFDRPKIESFVQELAKTVNQPPENAFLHFKEKENRVSVFKPSKEGLSLQEKELVQDLLDKLSQIESTQTSQEIIIPVVKTPPQISTKEVNTLGINELLSRGTSFFRGSIAERVHNINLASLKLNGLLIPPGEIFSFNNALGEVSQDTGFKQAYIIKEGRTVLGDGGGVCQVSTTLFRAALNAGLSITERHAHAYRVHYYEEDLGPGFDATVFAPSFDLKFVNDTPAYILIQSSLDLKQKKLTFELYGTKDNREVTISKARVWDQEPPPPDIYQDDPTLPTGTIKQVDWKAWGA